MASSPKYSKRICIIPQDARPVCSNLPAQLGEVIGIEVVMPAAPILGKLKKPCKWQPLQRWIKNHLFENAPVIVSLDMIAYGGLIPSRLGGEPVDEIKNRIQSFFEQVRAPLVYGFSSIMRIPDYNLDDEEPTYWRQYGKRIYQYSYQLHKNDRVDPQLVQEIPPEHIEDFLNRRRRNMEVNLSYLNRLGLGQLDYLSYCQDDTGAYGLNVREAKELASEVEKKGLAQSAHIQTGADEVAACMLTRWLSSQLERPLKVFPLYISSNGPKVIAKYDGQPIDAIITQQIQACGAKRVDNQAACDLVLLIHTPKETQGDHCFNKRPQMEVDQITQTLKTLQSIDKPVAIGDVAYANGADYKLVEGLIQDFPDFSSLYGYAAWNTAGNTIGTTLAIGLTRLMAEKQGKFNAKAFAKLLFTRFGDDWLYQSDVRKTMVQMSNGRIPEESVLNVQMASGLKLLQSRLGLEDMGYQCQFPCQRTFEIKIALK